MDDLTRARVAISPCASRPVAPPTQSKSPSFVMVAGGLSCEAEPGENESVAVRRRFSDCYNALMEACRMHGLIVRDVTYAVCLDNRPLDSLSAADYGHSVLCDFIARHGPVRQDAAAFADRLIRVEYAAWPIPVCYGRDKKQAFGTLRAADLL